MLPLKVLGQNLHLILTIGFMIVPAEAAPSVEKNAFVVTLRISPPEIIFNVVKARLTKHLFFFLELS